MLPSYSREVLPGGPDVAALRAVRARGVVAAGEARGGVYPACRDGLTTGFTKFWGDKEEPWVYYRRPHVGAACWFALAALDHNPYWGEAIPRK